MRHVTIWGSGGTSSDKGSQPDIRDQGPRQYGLSSILSFGVGGAEVTYDLKKKYV